MSLALNTFKHVYSSLGGFSHGIHEDDGQELAEDYPTPGSHQLVIQHLGKQFCRFFSHRRVCIVTEEVKKIKYTTYNSPLPATAHTTTNQQLQLIQQPISS